MVCNLFEVDLKVANIVHMRDLMGTKMLLEAVGGWETIKNCHYFVPCINFIFPSLF